MTSTSASGANAPQIALSNGKTKRRVWQAGFAAALLVSGSPLAYAETSNTELAQEIAELKSQIREMKGSLAKTNAKVRVVASHSAAPYVLPPPAMAMPAGATPVFVTADKKFQFGELTITPGGYVAAESVFRSRNLQADLISPFNSIPFPNNSLGHTNEFRPSARQTRAAVLVEAPISPTMTVSGYGELDFLGAASTANENQTNSYTPRIRELYAGLDNTEYGMHVLAGQNWSLVTLNTKGITPRNELTPNVIDAQQTVGSLYARQAQIRLTKDFGKKLWVALSVEESQDTGCPTPTNPIANPPAAGPATSGTTTTGSTGIQTLPNGVTAICDSVGQGGSFVGAPQAGVNYSFNHLPDVIGKVAYEAKVADRDVHLEATGLFTDLYDRVEDGGTAGAAAAGTIPNGGTFSNKDTTGYGVGAGIVVPLVPKTLDLQVNGMYGKGIERYGASQLPSASFNPDGSLRPVEGYIGLVGLTYHATPALDFYGYGGIEGEKRTFTALNATGTSGTGPGSPSTNDSGCYTEGGSSTLSVCNGATHNIYQADVGFWDKLYKGAFGEVRVGVQYQYTVRELFNSNDAVGPGGIAPAGAIKSTTYTPRTDENAVFTSLRYYPFAPSAPPVAVVAKY